VSGLAGGGTVFDGLLIGMGISLGFLDYDTYIMLYECKKLGTCNGQGTG
jgi:hypothetical protein